MNDDGSPVVIRFFRERQHAKAEYGARQFAMCKARRFDIERVRHVAETNFLGKKQRSARANVCMIRALQPPGSRR